MEFKLIGSNRKTVAIQVNPDLSITVRAPRYASKREIDRIVEKNETWIYKHIEIIKKNKADYEALNVDSAPATSSTTSAPPCSLLALTNSIQSSGETVRISG